ncbi:MAG: hypothetical protein KatS3mg024_0169 [Armatimonadota bacterium]|nr:MAG: hypothetical protein KatS3mg024_0169 [Armatimonadota bacterium]
MAIMARFLTALLLLLASTLVPAGCQEMLVASRGSDRILRFDAEGNYAGVFASGALAPSPSCLAVGPDGRLYAGVRESSGLRGVACWDRGGAYRFRLTATGLGDLSGVAVDASGNVYASSTGDVVRWNQDRSFFGTFSYGSGLAEPAGLVFSADGKLFIASAGSGQVLIWNADGTFNRVFRSFGASARPLDVALSHDGSVYVLLRLSGGQTGVGVYSSSGSFVRFHSGGALMPSPTGLALRPSDDAVFVTDSTTGLLRLGADGLFRVVVPAGAHGLSQASAVRFRTDLQVSDNSLLVQGLLSTADGNPVPDGVYQLRFRFYAQPSGGGVLWSSPDLPTQTQSGVFMARLEQVPASVFVRGSVWMETVLGGVTLSPRQLLGAQGLAIRTASAAGLRTASGGVATFRAGSRPALTMTADASFTAVASGGALFATAFDSAGQASAGPRLAPGAGAWSTLSDASLKVWHGAVEPEDILSRLQNLPVFFWRYRTQGTGTLHIGPMAHDFHSVFGVGEMPGAISTVDPDGVAMAAVQGLLRRIEQQETTIRRLEEQIRRTQERAAR